MPNGLKSTWLAAHLYYNEPWEEFLTKAVEPYIRTVMRTGVAEQYFFIRYWDQGPHIRLRFKGEETIINQLLRPNLYEHFNNYFESRPSERMEPEYPADIPDSLRWLPNNTIQWVPYTPEYNRYGGLTGMAITERQFQASSDVTLHHIRQRGFKWSYDDALGTAIKLHLSFAHTIGLSLAEVCDFFGMIFYNWLPRSFRLSGTIENSGEYRQKSEETLLAFRQSFSLQKEALLPFHRTLWEALEAAEEFEEEALNTWLTQMAVIRLQMETTQSHGELSPRQANYYLSDRLKAYLSPARHLLWGIYADFIHMTNNRLGILNKDEGYLGFIIMESLRAIYGDTDQSVNWFKEDIDRSIIDELF